MRRRPAFRDLLPRGSFVLALALAVVACAGRPPATGVVPAVEATLDDFHRAASEAAGDRYFAHFTDDAVFLGTDATERWSVAEFRAYAEPHFSAGKGWTYDVVDRHVGVGPRGDLAWFDERLENEKYGEVRGSGVLRRVDGRWRIAQYNLSFPVPNDLAKDLVERIRAAGGR